MKRFLSRRKLKEKYGFWMHTDAAFGVGTVRVRSSVLILRGLPPVHQTYVIL